MTMQALSVFTQNILGGGPAWRLRRRVISARIAQLAPDVIALQEVTAPSSIAPSQAHEIAALLTERGLLYHVDFAPGRIWPAGRCEGVAILCREGIRERSVESLSLDPRDRWEGQSQRIVLCAMLDLPMGPVDIFATHLSLSRAARSRTIREVLAFVRRERARSRSRAAVLLGDLNAQSNEDAIKMLDKEWLDLSRLESGRATPTWPCFFPFRRLDYIFVQPGNAFRVLSRGHHLSGSDHLGISACLGAQSVLDS